MLVQRRVYFLDTSQSKAVTAAQDVSSRELFFTSTGNTGLQKVTTTKLVVFDRSLMCDVSLSQEMQEREMQPSCHLLVAVICCYLLVRC